MKTLYLASALVVGASVPAMALEVTKSADIAAPPDKVWATISEFCSIGTWHPAVEKCDPSKMGGHDVRTLSLKGGGTIKEERLSHSDKKMEYTYRILESPLPVSGYKSTLMVAPAAGGSKVTWKGTFKAKGAPDAKAEEAIGGIYEAGFKGIADKVK